MRSIRIGILSAFLVTILATPVLAGDWPPAFRTWGKTGHAYGHKYGSDRAYDGRSSGYRSPRWGRGSYGYRYSSPYYGYGGRSYGHDGSGYRNYGSGHRGYGHSGSSFSFGFGPRSRCDR